MRSVARYSSVLLVGLVTAAAAPHPVDPVLYEVDTEHSTVQFKVRHMGVGTVTGQFNRFAASFWYDPADPGATRVTATIDVASVDTDNERRDTHLRSEDFFWAERHPTITFESREVRATGDDAFEVAGDLTIRGVTLPVTLEVRIEGAGRTGRGQPIIGLTATGEINRHDYGLRWNRVVETGWLVGDSVRIILEVEAKGPAVETPPTAGER
jgi:polyisoprenoid-binding protein YceI